MSAAERARRKAATHTRRRTPRAAALPAAVGPTQPISQDAAASPPVARVFEGRLVRWLLVASGLLGLPAVAGLLRGYGLTRSLDIYVDELTYTDITRHLALHGKLGTAAGPFYLHPVGYFALGSLWWHVTRVSGDLFQEVYGLRGMSVLIACLITLLVFLVAYRVGGLGAAFLAGILIAVDPFSIRWTSLVMLEPASILWSLTALAVLVHALRRDRAPTIPEALLAGLLCGLSVVTKDMAVFATLAPVVAFTFLDRRRLPVRRLVTVVAVATAVYGAYVVYVARTGSLHAFINQKTRGLSRMVGALQESGFHQKGSISFGQALLLNLDRYAFTYVLMGAGVLAAALLLSRRRPAAERLVGLWVMGPAALLAFAVLKGALEDHFFLYLLVPSVIALAAAAPRVRSLRLPVRRRGTLAALLAAALLAGIVSDAVVWGRLRSRPDDGYQHLVTYLANDLPRDSIVGVDLGDPLWQAARVTDRSAALQGQAVHLANQLVGPWHSKKSLRAHRVRYMIVNQKIVAEHLATGSTTFYQWLPRHARLVFSVKEDSYDRLSVYEMPASYWSP